MPSASRPMGTGLFQTVVWLGPDDDPQATTEGYLWRDCAYAQTTTVHQTGDLDYMPIPGGRT